MRNLNLGTVFLLCHLTSAWREWSSDSGRCWCICGTAARPKDSTAPASQTVAFAPSPLPPSPPWATLSPSTRQIAHFRGYRRTQRPGKALANTSLCLPPSDWMQAQKAWKKWEKLKCKDVLNYTPAYHTCRFLQQIAEGLTLLAHSHPFNPAPKQLVPVSISGRYPVSPGTLSTTLQNRVEISISEQLTSSLLPCQEPLRGKSRL